VLRVSEQHRALVANGVVTGTALAAAPGSRLLGTRSAAAPGDLI
jgi:hypothetical protein